MKVKELRKLREIIYNIYYNGESPKKFYEITKIENYMDELYPPNGEIFGPFIQKNFDTKYFIKEDELQKGFEEISKLLNKVRFYANLPTQSDGQIVEIFKELKGVANFDGE